MKRQDFLRPLGLAFVLSLFTLTVSAQKWYTNIGLDLRSGPGGTYGSISVLPRGAAITVDFGRARGEWVPVSYGRRHGYVQRRYITSYPYCKECRKNMRKAHKHHDRYYDKHRHHDNGHHYGEYKKGKKHKRH